MGRVGLALTGKRVATATAVPAIDFFYIFCIDWTVSEHLTVTNPHHSPLTLTDR